MLIIFVKDNSMTSNIYRARNVYFLGSMALELLEELILPCSAMILYNTLEHCMKFSGCSNNQVGGRRKREGRNALAMLGQYRRKYIVIIEISSFLCLPSHLTHFSFL
jgi:hypothetical protein